MKRNSISALLAAVMLATAALSGCATTSGESFLQSENTFLPIDREGSA